MYKKIYTANVEGTNGEEFPWSTCFRSGKEFLESAGTFGLEELSGRYEIRYLGFGYFLATPEGMEESAGTEAEHIEGSIEEAEVEEPFVFRNEWVQMEYQQFVCKYEMGSEEA